jgi:predicted MPP superfamily phosphohydrolase
MKKIIHFSDLHVGFEHCLGHFNQVVTNLIFKKEPASDYVVIVTGDLVEDATRDGLYELALTEINRIKAAGFLVLLCPGNHDYGTGALGHKRYVAKFKQTFFGVTNISYPKLDIIDGTAFIGLDSMAEELHWYDALFPRASSAMINSARFRRCLGQMRSEEPSAASSTCIIIPLSQGLSTG